MSGTFTEAPGSTKNSIRWSGVSVTGPRVRCIRSRRASARNPAVSGTSSASKVRPVGSRIDASGRLPHTRLTCTPLPVASAAQSFTAGCAPGAGQSCAPQEHNSRPSTGSSQVPAKTSQCRSSAYRTAWSSSCSPRCLGMDAVSVTPMVFSTPITTSAVTSGYGGKPPGGRCIDPAYGAHWCMGGGAWEVVVPELGSDTTQSG